MTSKYMVDETQLNTGSELIWLWVAIDSKNKQILALSISKERNTFVAEVYRRLGQGLWKAFYFNRWWHMVSTSM